jgi:hypothetical protein
MSASQKLKLVARNAPALRKTLTPNPQPQLIAGNSISTRLESGIGNCFPGLECDLRNLERRFFPFLEMDMPDADITLVKVDMPGVIAARAEKKISQAALSAYKTLAAEGTWNIETIQGTFGPLGKLALTLSQNGISSKSKRRLPVDAWTAVRLLTEGTEVRLALRRSDTANAMAKVELRGKRASYLGDDGALAAMFAPGELTQSLCSPWTHDFRDCACYYWASNHPDIVLPPYNSAPTSDPKFDIPVPWERRDRSLDRLPKPATSENPEDVELRYFEINRRWQALNFVLERREQIGPYAQREFTGKPLRDEAELKIHLRYAAGVELAVLQEYLAAVYSLKPEGALQGTLRDDVRAAKAEIMRIALGEMRHLRAVNNVLATFGDRSSYRPALGVATRIPGAKAGKTKIVKPGALTRDAVDQFIEIEAPSEAVDGVYAHILATLNQESRDDNKQAIRTIMAEGEDHYRTFLAIKEWLAPYDEAQYLRATNLQPAPKSNKEHRALQQPYLNLLDFLYSGYRVGLPNGAIDLNKARNAMVQKDGVADRAEAVASAGFLVTFDVPADNRFRAVDPP